MSRKPKEAASEEPAQPFGGGVIMPHVVSPEIAGGEVNTPRIVPNMVGEKPAARASHWNVNGNKVDNC